MKRNLLLTAAAAVCLTWPAAALADPPADHGGGGGQDQPQKAEGGSKGGHGQDQAQKPAQGGQSGHGGQGVQGGQPQGRVVAHAAPTGQGPAAAHVVQGAPASAQVPDVRRAGSFGQGRADRQPRVMNPQLQGGPPAGQRAGGNTSGRSQQGAAGFAVAPARAQRNRPAFAVAPAVAQQGQAPGGHSQAFARQPVRPANVQVLSGWNRTAAGPAREQAGQQWRQAHSGWDSGARWRGNQNWWRGDAGFRLFGGERIGFFFIPELGYVSAPAEYRSHHWRAGDQLPNWFWRYQVRDYWNYGLPEPPDGCAWVWVDNDVALIDASDGYILNIDHNVW